MKNSSSSELTISVAMCTYNGSLFIEQQLRSILAQTLLPAEIVISDDGSSDDTVAIAQAIADDYTRSNPHSMVFRFLHNTESRGVARNFQHAIQATTSQLVALSDQDDVWAEDRLEKLINQFASDPDLLLVGSGAEAIDAMGKPMGFTLFQAIAVTPGEWEQLESGNAFDSLVRRNIFTGATMIFRRELFNIAAPFATYWLHDEWLAIVGAAVGKVALSRLHLTGYRQHGANVAGIKGQSLLTKIRKVAKLFESRGNRNISLRIKAQELVEKLESLQVREPASLHDHLSNRLLTARRNLEHEEYRLLLPGIRLLRVRPILRELASGRYHAYDYGRKDALRDLMQSR